MEIIQWYMISFFGILAILGLYRFWLLILRFISRHLTVRFAQKLQYPLLIQRRYWAAMTRLQALCLTFYVGANIAVLAAAAGDVREVERRAAVAAVTNLTPLFLGGRTNPLADVMGLPLPAYYLAHHWIGRVAIAEAFIHSVAVLALRARPGAVTTSGYIASLSLISILISSFYFSRRYLGGLFSKVHSLLALGLLCGAIWHVFLLSSTPAKVLVCVAPVLWLLTTVYRLVITLYRGTGARIEGIWEYNNVTRIELYTKRSIRAFPGSYFYVSFPGSCWHYDVLNSYPMAVAWYEPHELSSDEGTRNISFVMSRSGRHSHHVEKLKVGDLLLLEGPYGKDLQLQAYENVILVAKGIGILGLLPFALYLAERSEHDDSIRRVLDEYPARVKEWLKKVKSWEEDNKDLSKAEEELRAGEMPFGWAVRPDNRKRDLARARKWLEKERRRIDEEGEVLKEERATIEKEREIASSSTVFRDSTRHVDLFWTLEYNGQFKWVAEYLKALKDLDPYHTLLVFWGDFPTALAKGAKNPFKDSDQDSDQDSDHWLCLYPDEGRRSFNKMVLSTVEREAASPGKTIVVGCGDAAFTNDMRDGVIKFTRPDRPIEFVEVEYQPRNKVPSPAASLDKTRSNGLAAVASDGDSYVTLSDEKSGEKSYTTQTSRGSYGDIV